MNSQYPVFSDIGPGPLPGMHNEQYLLLLDSATVRHLYGYHGTGRIHGLRILQEGLRQQRWQDYVILGADIPWTKIDFSI